MFGLQRLRIICFVCMVALYACTSVMSICRYNSTSRSAEDLRLRCVGGVCVASA